jgi:hypothetical protein
VNLEELEKRTNLLSDKAALAARSLKDREGVFKLLHELAAHVHILMAYLKTNSERAEAARPVLKMLDNLVGFREAGGFVQAAPILRLYEALHEDIQKWASDAEDPR